MYLGIDIGGTKTLLTTFSAKGESIHSIKFPTPQNYKDFLRELANTVASLSTREWHAACVALPGRVDRSRGVGVACGNLPWKNVPIQSDVQKLLQCLVIVENDANLAGLSEANLIKNNYSRVLYVTISTGIGMGVITNTKIDPDFQDAEGGEIVLEHNGKLLMWEKFASGSAIVKDFGQEAWQITSSKTWSIIARNIAIGLTDLCAIVQPQIIVLGGGVGEHFDKFKLPLINEMEKITTPLNPMPVIKKAQRAEEAVVFGCFILAKELYEKNNSRRKV